MWSGKLYTTPTVLSSWEALKKTNSVWILFNFAPVLFPKGSPLDGTNRSRGLEKTAASCNRDPSAGGVAIRRCEDPQGPWQSHRARRQTLHHLNSALVGGSLEKNEFCRCFVEFLAGHCYPFCSRRFPLLSLHSLLSGHLNFGLWLRRCISAGKVHIPWIATPPPVSFAGS